MAKKQKQTEALFRAVSEWVAKNRRPKEEEGEDWLDCMRSVLPGLQRQGHFVDSKAYRLKHSWIQAHPKYHHDDWLAACEGVYVGESVEEAAKDEKEKYEEYVRRSGGTSLSSVKVKVAQAKLKQQMFLNQLLSLKANAAIHRAQTKGDKVSAFFVEHYKNLVSMPPASPARLAEVVNTGASAINIPGIERRVGFNSGAPAINIPGIGRSVGLNSGAPAINIPGIGRSVGLNSGAPAINIPGIGRSVGLNSGAPAINIPGIGRSVGLNSGAPAINIPGIGRSVGLNSGAPAINIPGIERSVGLNSGAPAINIPGIERRVGLNSGAPAINIPGIGRSVGINSGPCNSGDNEVPNRKRRGSRPKAEEVEEESEDGETLGSVERSEDSSDEDDYKLYIDE